MSWVVAKTFTNRPEAEMTKEILEQESIPAVIRSDDSGGMHPGLTFTSGVDLLVRIEDLEEALGLLGEKK